MSPGAGIVLGLLRVFLGGLLAYSGFVKLRDPQPLAFALKGFQLELSEGLLVRSAFVLPWTELFSGLLLFLGIWARGAALVIALLMLLFAGAIVSLLVRDLKVDCPCFANLDVFCTGSLGACHLARNGLFLAAALVLTRFGPGSMPWKVRSP